MKSKVACPVELLSVGLNSVPRMEGTAGGHWGDCSGPRPMVGLGEHHQEPGTVETVTQHLC